MLQSDRKALHYEVVANTAHKIERKARELASLYKDSYFNSEKAELNKNHLQEYFGELCLYLDR